MRLSPFIALTAGLSLSLFHEAFAQSDPSLLTGYMCNRAEFGTEELLDLTGSSVTFNDDFDVPDIVPIGHPGKWYAAVHGGFGGAKFLPYRPNEDPFWYKNGTLSIRMAKRGNSWTSGIIQTVDRAGRGFSQQLGYFEMRAKFQAGMATWPAFWLKTPNEYTDPTQTRTEIDIIEAYGGEDQFGYHASVHLWPARRLQPGDPVQKHWWKSCYRKMPVNLFDGAYHTYGTRITPEWVIMYFDRREVLRFPTLPEFKRPMFLLVDLAYNTKERRMGDEASEITIDYVRVWDR